MVITQVLTKDVAHSYRGTKTCTSTTYLLSMIPHYIQTSMRSKLTHDKNICKPGQPPHIAYDGPHSYADHISLKYETEQNLGGC